MHQLRNFAGNWTSKWLSNRGLCKKDSVHAQIKDLRKFVRESVGDIRTVLTGKHANPAVIRQELARHIDSITLLPDGKGDETRYKGEWKLLGDIGGAEGQS